MPRHDNFSAWITIEGVETEEYQVEKDGSKVTCWIASEENKTFEIHFKLHGAPIPLTATPYVDGATYSRKLVHSNPHQQYEFSGVRVSETTRRPYKFSRLTLTDNDDAFNQSMQNVGDIKVEISRVQVHRIQHTHGPRVYKPIPDAGEYSEKTKKGIDHQVDFGDPVVTHRTLPQHYHAVPVGNPLVVFCFKYRPLGVLRALDIAPPPRGPVQRATETTAIDLTSDGDESETDNKELEALKVEVFHLNPSVGTHYQRNPY
ncbi:hypothetical protein EDD85DRAFT_839830 [Armillaria nabsnona]|nr:hypothetical protein EDD85DRAFT_839830 [Armillaria nabsnona]